MIRHDHASRLARSLLVAPGAAPWRQIDGTALLADLTGFTRLTEGLAGRGPEGAEVLHRTLNLCFTALLAPSIDSGGDIIGFAGDAALVWFDGADHERRATDAALEMPTNLAWLPASVTGGRRLHVGVALRTGVVTVLLVGRGQCDLFLCGPGISSLVALARSSAGAGAVIADPTLARRLPEAMVGEPVGDGVALRRQRSRRPSAPAARPAEEVEPPISDELLLSLLSPPVREIVGADEATGDHRTVSVAFVAVSGLDELMAARGPHGVWETLDRAATMVATISDDHGIAWLGTDVGRGSIKFLLTAGAPRAVDDDEDRLLGALGRILAESPVPLRAGAQRGRVFAGLLGVPGRRGLTVLGDAVNVAARLLARAGDGELIVGDGMDVAARPYLQAVALGPQEVRNRARAVGMWRVTAITTRDPVRPQRNETIVGGRAREHELVRDAWKAAAGGDGSVMSVVAEPGMGASELLAAAVDLAGSAGTLVAAEPYQRRTPHAGTAQIGRALAAAAAAGDHADEWEWLSSFATHLGPAVRNWLDDGRRALRREPRPDGVDPATAAVRAQRVLTELIELAAPRPWLLAVDDVDALDEPSRAVVHALGRAACHAGWLVLTSTADAAHSAVDETSSTMVLAPLEDGEATQLVLDTNPGLRDDQVGRIVAAAKGNPFVLTELAHHPSVASLPDSLERLGAMRIDELAGPARQLVREASTFGSRISLTLAAEVLGRPTLADLQGWAGTESVLRSDDDDAVAFRNDVFRRAAHSGLAFRRRRELHGRLADHLAARGDTSDAVLALHYEEAGRKREAFPYALAAGRAARDAGAMVAAVDLLGQATRLANEVDRGSAGSVALEHGDALIRLGDLAGADKAFSSAARMLSDPIDYASMCSHRAALALRRSQFRRARSWVQKGLALVTPADTDRRAVEVRGRLLLDDAAALHYTGRHAESLELIDDVLALARQSSMRTLEGRAHLHAEMAYSALFLPEAVRHGDAAIAIFEELGHDRYLAEALANSALTAMTAGRWQEATERNARAAAVAARSGDTTDAAILEINQGFLKLRQGHFDAAEEHAHRAQRTFDTVATEVYGGYAHLLRASIAGRTGRYAEAASEAASARATFEGAGDRAMVVDCDVEVLDRLLRAGQLTEALSLAATIGRDIEHGDVSVQIAFARLRGITDARSGDPAAGAAQVAAALAVARDRQLLWEEHECLVALVEIAEIGGLEAPDGASARRAAIAESLQLATR